MILSYPLDYWMIWHDQFFKPMSCSCCKTKISIFGIGTDLFAVQDPSLITSFDGNISKV